MNINMQFRMFVLVSLTLAVLSSAYSEQKAILHARYSVITHCPTQQIQQWSCKPCRQYPHLTHLSPIVNTATQISGFIGYDQLRNSIVIAWRGTVDTRNWIQDLNFRQIDFNFDPQCQKCKIHDGFYNAYQSVSGRVKDKVKQLTQLYPSATLSITGHSLGGAIAEITAIYMWRQYSQKIKDVYVFGCPRIGNRNLAHYMNKIVPQIYRVIHNRDLVPHAPVQDMNYFHPAYEVLYQKDFKHFQICSQTGEDPKCSNRYAPDYNLNDHTFYWFKTDDSVC